MQCGRARPSSLTLWPCTKCPCCDGGLERSVLTPGSTDHLTMLETLTIPRGSWRRGLRVCGACLFLSVPVEPSDYTRVSVRHEVDVFVRFSSVIDTGSQLFPVGDLRYCSKIKWGNSSVESAAVAYLNTTSNVTELLSQSQRYNSLEYNKFAKSSRAGH